MVHAAELTVGEYVEFEGEVVELTELMPVIPPELGPDGRVKLTLTLANPEGESKTYVAVASEEFQLADAPGVDIGASKRRAGVSSESGVGEESFEKWDKKVVPKSEAERESILKIIKSNVFFAYLDESEENDLIDVVFEKTFGPGDVLMNQGDEGDLFYVVDSGNADIYVLDDGGNEQMVRSCKAGDSFGELALMYNAPRNATIKARNDLKCWCMDRQIFKFVILGSSIKKRDRYLGFLDSVEILGTMERAEKMKMVDALIPRKVEKGTVIVKQGDAGDMFYIVESGKLVVMQTTPEGKEERVNEKKPGDVFGEIALMSDMPRTATVIASEDCVLLTLDRNTFVSLMGPMEPLLRRNLALYKTYIDYTDV